jgi:hypothetical protein
VNGVDLAEWIQDKRHRHGTGQLPPAHAAALEQLGIDWRPRESAWDKGLRALREFKDAHGHTDVPQGHVAPGGYRLGKWWTAQRAARHRGTLSQDRVTALEELGARWDTPADRRRAVMITALRDFAASAGHADVPGGHVTADGLKLGAWLADTCQRLRNGHATHPETLAALRECGVPGTAPPARSPVPAAAGDGLVTAAVTPPER